MFESTTFLNYLAKKYYRIDRRKVLNNKIEPKWSPIIDRRISFYWILMMCNVHASENGEISFFIWTFYILYNYVPAL